MLIKVDTSVAAGAGSKWKSFDTCIPVTALRHQSKAKKSSNANPLFSITVMELLFCYILESQNFKRLFDRNNIANKPGNKLRMRKVNITKTFQTTVNHIFRAYIASPTWCQKTKRNNDLDGMMAEVGSKSYKFRPNYCQVSEAKPQCCTTLLHKSSAIEMNERRNYNTHNTQSIVYILQKTIQFSRVKLNMPCPIRVYYDEIILRKQGTNIP